MDDSLAPMVVFITGALVAGAVLRALILNRRLTATARLWAELQGKVVDRFGAAPEVIRYLESDAGQKMLAGHTSATATPHSRILDSIHLGLLIMLGGIGLVAAGGMFGIESSAIRPLGRMATFLGAGYLLSAAVSWWLMKRWHLLPAAPPTAAEESPIR